ncbi:type VI secretion system ATPase TssH [Pseudomonas floridensis]
MINVDLQQLVNALDVPTRQDLESCAGRCVARGGSLILVDDLLLALLERPQSLLVRALKDADQTVEHFTAEVRPAIEQSASGNPVFATELVQWLQDAWIVASLELHRSHIDQAALILAVLRNPLRHAGSRYQALLSNIDADRLKEFALAEQVADKECPTGTTDDPLLKRFTRNLTHQAREGRLDPVLCRDDAIRQMVDILARRRKNNPIVVGEAGVGKTAVVEGLALRIIHGQVPESLKNVELLTLDMGLLQAGASVKGEFERRLNGVIEEVRSSPRAIILFIDEAHTLIGAGAQAGGSDAANLLKPALARGELRTIAATTWSEYKKYFEKDPALARRFQPVRVLEPTVEEAITILRGLVSTYETSHGIYVRDDAVVAAARLSARYLTGRQLPDKAIDLLDTACARVRIGLTAIPENLERLRARTAEDQRQSDAIRRDAEAGIPIDDQVLSRLEVRLQEQEQQATRLDDSWRRQSADRQQLLTLRKQLAELRAQQARVVAAGNEFSVDDYALIRTLEAEQTRIYDVLAKTSLTGRLVNFEVCPKIIAEVLSGWTGIPLSQLAQEYSAKVGSFAGDLKQRIRGQDQAVQALDRSMRAVAAGLNKPQAPVGVYLLVGPSGVGKTETAVAVADLLYGGDRFLTTINMSEFQEKHTVSRLIGAPPGYVGYGEGGLLTEAVRQKPYSVVLLDEVEKADLEVMNLFYQIFDKGIANDGEGREIDFRNTLILMTSNLGSELISAHCQPDRQVEVEELEALLQPLLSGHFMPALLARMQVIPYYPIHAAVLCELIEIKLQQLGARLKSRKVAFDYSPRLVTFLSERCAQSETGARRIDRLLDDFVIPLIANRLLSAMSDGENVHRIHVTLDADDRVVCEFD